MAKPPIVVGPHSFRTKDEAKKYFGSLLKVLPLGRVPAAYVPELAALLELHPETEKKIGPGIDHFIVRPNPYQGYGDPQFAVVRVDGTVVEFSKNAPFEKQSPWKDVQKAAREAVADDTGYFKALAFSQPPVLCAETGVELTLETVHVDHKAPLTFQVLLHTFLHAHRYMESDWPRLVIDLGSGVALSDEVRETFRDYHKRAALLQLVHRDPHLKCASQHRIKRPKQ